MKISLKGNSEIVAFATVKAMLHKQFSWQLATQQTLRCKLQEKIHV